LRTDAVNDTVKKLAKQTARSLQDVQACADKKEENL